MIEFLLSIVIYTNVCKNVIRRWQNSQVGTTSFYRSTCTCTLILCVKAPLNNFCCCIIRYTLWFIKINLIYASYRIAITKFCRVVGLILSCCRVDFVALSHRRAILSRCRPRQRDNTTMAEISHNSIILYYIVLISVFCRKINIITILIIWQSCYCKSVNKYMGSIDGS